MSKVFVCLVVAVTICCFTSTFASEPECKITGTPNQTALVTCPLGGTVGITWFKDGAQLVTADKKYTVNADNGTLTISKIGGGTVGEFVCSATGFNASVVVCSVPYVHGYDKDKNVIEGDPLIAECQAWGYPQVTVSWYKDGLLLTADDRVTFKNGSVENSTLRVDKMAPEDAGDYVCIVTSSTGAQNVTLVVNVKDKYAALWPFLGICAEVAILCTIIFLFERRRTKRLAKEAAAEETDYMTANNDAKGSEDVRHRK